jgi:hypothetical protein
METKSELTEIFNTCGGDKGSYFTHTGAIENLAHNYTYVYEKYMSDFRDQDINLLEIGLWCPHFPGASIKAWNQYFTNINYYGIDIVDCTHMSDKKINISIVDQRNVTQIQDYLNDKPKFKFIIDDGCHEEDAIIISLGNFFPKLENGGIYFIEDLHVVDKKNLYELKNKKFNSNYLSQEQNDYINNNISECFFELKDKLCVIIKK